MISTLAQAQDGGAARALANVFSRIDPLAHPQELVEHLQQVPIVLAGVFVAAGMVCLLQGFRLYKAVVVTIAMITGMAVGYRLGLLVEAEMIVGVCLGVLLAVVAWPLMKYAVALAGGLAGAFVGANCWTVLATEMTRHGINANPEMPWIGAMIGLLMLGLLSFIVFDVAVVVFTSVSGSVLAVIGIVAMLLQVEPWRATIAENLASKPIVLVLLILVPAVIGLVLQHQRGAFGGGGGAKEEAKPAAAKA